jgi:hypothetical protein
MALPPVDAGAVHPTTADESPGVAVTDVGGPGVVAGVTAFDEAEEGPAPAALVAVTVNV